MDFLLPPTSLLPGCHEALVGSTGPGRVVGLDSLLGLLLGAFVWSSGIRGTGRRALGHV